MVTGVELLLLVFAGNSPPPPTTAAGTVKGVPTCEAVGMKGTLNVLLLPFAITTEFVHVAVVPEVVQTQPLLLDGNVPKVVPAGICTTSVMEPVVGAVPILATVTGIELG